MALVRIDLHEGRTPEGVHNMEVLDAVATSAADHGSIVALLPVSQVSDHGKVLS